MKPDLLNLLYDYVNYYYIVFPARIQFLTKARLAYACHANLT